MLKFMFEKLNNLSFSDNSIYFMKYEASGIYETQYNVVCNIIKGYFKCRRNKYGQNNQRCI